jgi:hypothetical protein
MAWQLIYTSAPRLLEAGRTGFGTVARHRAVSGMLVSTVERFSQFARLPGHDPRRVVHTYRILTVGSGTYHVFSCLQDAGSDYTGRTNHLAQHVIAEAREIRALSASGLTPADILLAMPWRSTWTEAPRFLDPAEEIDLAGFRPATTCAWASATGNPAYARLLCMPQALKGCYLIPPPGVNVLELFREAMREAPQGGWQTSFTTTLEPNDEVGDFRWIGLPSGSPLRSQAEVSNRPLLDLTQPSKLPAPPEPPAQPAPLRREPEAVAAHQAEPAMTMRSPDKVSLNRPPEQPIPAATMGGWSPETRKAAPKKSGKRLMVAIVVVSLLVASTAGFFLWQHVNKTKERAAFQAQIKQVWDKHGLALIETRKRISDEPNLETGRTLLGSLQAYVEGVEQALKNSGSKAEPPIPEDTAHLTDFEDLKNAFEEWREIEKQGSTLAGNTASTLLGASDKWVKGRTRCWKTLAENLKKIGTLPKNKVVRDKLVETAKELLRTTEPDTKDMPVWEQLNKSLENDPTITEWLKIWSDLDGSDKLKVASTAQKNELLPPWLIKKALKVQDASKPTQPTGKPMIAVKPAATIKPNNQDADTLDGKHPIYICLLKKGDTSIVINEPDGLPLEKEMQIYVGGAWDRHTIPDGASPPRTGDLQRYEKYEAEYFKNKFNIKEQHLGFGETGKGINLSADLLNSDKGCRIVARSEDESRVLFDVRILPWASATALPVLWQIVPVTAVNDGNFKLQGISGLLSRLNGWATAPPSYRLRFEGSVSEQVIYELKAADGSSYSVLPPALANAPSLRQRYLISRKKELNERIKSEDDELKKNEASKASEKTKNFNREKYTKAKNDAEIELKKTLAELAEIENQKASPFALKPGSYMLLETNTEVCKVDVVSPSKNPKTPNSKR